MDAKALMEEMTKSEDHGYRLLLDMSDDALCEFVRSVDPFSWQWRNRETIVAIMFELVDRMEGIRREEEEIKAQNPVIDSFE